MLSIINRSYFTWWGPFLLWIRFSYMPFYSFIFSQWKLDSLLKQTFLKKKRKEKKNVVLIMIIDHWSITSIMHQYSNSSNSIFSIIIKNLKYNQLKTYKYNNIASVHFHLQHHMHSIFTWMAKIWKHDSMQVSGRGSMYFQNCYFFMNLISSVPSRCGLF